MSGFFRMWEASSAKAVSRTWWLPFSMRQGARIHSFQRSDGWPAADEPQKDGLAGLPTQSGLRVAFADRALKSQHGFDEALPRRTAKPRLGREHRQFAAFPAIAACDLARVRANRLSPCGSQFEPAAQTRLVVHDLDKHVIA